MDRLSRFWAAVRPRTRRGAVLATVAIVGGAAAVSVALTVGATMAWSPYVDLRRRPRVERSRLGALRARLRRQGDVRRLPRAAGRDGQGEPAPGRRLRELPRPARRPRRRGRGVPRDAHGARGAHERDLPGLPPRHRGTARRTSRSSTSGSTTSRSASSATTRTQASRSGRRRCSTRSPTFPTASPATGPTGSRPATSVIPTTRPTTPHASSAMPRDAAP